MAWFRNFYQHKDCKEQPGIEWQDEWDCMCNDKCPACNKEIEPYKSEDLSEYEDDKEAENEQADYAAHVGDGCVNCGSESTYETKVTFDGVDNVPACICDECGHTLKKPE